MVVPATLGEIGAVTEEKREDEVAEALADSATWVGETLGGGALEIVESVHTDC